MSLPGMSRAQMKEKEVTMPEVLLDPWLRVGDRMMVHAADGLGKSWLAMAMAMAVAGGGRVMGWQAPKPARVLFIDAELSFAELDYRQSALVDSLDGIDVDALDQNLWTVSQVDFDAGASEWPTPEESPNELCRWAEAHGHGDGWADLVVLDNLFGLTDVVDANQAAQWRPLNDLTRRLKRNQCATLMVHHDTKDGHGYSGSADLSRELDCRLHVQSSGQREPGEAEFRLVCRKDRHGQSSGWSGRVALRGDATRGESLAWELDEGDGSGGAGEAAEADPRHDRCRKLMATARADVFSRQSALAEELGVTDKTLRKYIGEAVDLGLVNSSASFAELMKDEPAEPAGDF